MGILASPRAVAAGGIIAAIEWLKKYAHLAKKAPSWGVLLTLAWGGEPRYSFLYAIPS
jgi:hypothetical protein